MNFIDFPENKDVSLSAGKMLLKGEVNLAKYLCSLLGLLPNRNATLDDARLDDVHKSVIWNDDSKIILSNIQQLCSVQGFLGGKEFGLSDLVACSKVRQVSNCSTLITQWLERCDQYLRGSHPKALKKQEDSDPKNRLLQYLKDNEIAFENIEHPEVFTVEAMMPYLTNVKGAVAKNLFLKDKKGGLFLLSALHNRNINLTTIAKTVKAPGLRFASEDLLIEVLGVKQGCVTAFALINDTEKRVKFLADEELVNGNYTTVFFHPLVNTATTGVSCDDFKKFVCLTGHDIRTIQI